MMRGKAHCKPRTEHPPRAKFNSCAQPRRARSTLSFAATPETTRRDSYGKGPVKMSTDVPAKSCRQKWRSQSRECGRKRGSCARQDRPRQVSSSYREWWSWCLGRLFFHAVLQGANTLAQALAEFGQFFGAKDQKGDEKNDQQVHRLEQAFKHYQPPGELEPFKVTELEPVPRVFEITPNCSLYH